jgi:1-aminocyclopropane-1-carboxylate deaminase
MGVSMKLDAFSRYPLLFGPSPVHPLERLSAYGIPDDRTLEAIRLVARLEGMLTDPVYEGKSMAGLIDLVSSGEIGKGSAVLYAHLGGQPALNAYSTLFR